MSSPSVPYWLLIAVLQSTTPLSPALAMRLCHAALALHRESRAVEKLTGELAVGEVRRLDRSLVLGAIGGPGFEAELDTPTGHGSVRFILTRQALEMGEAGDGADEAPPQRRGLPN